MDILSQLNTLQADYSAAQTLLEEAKQAQEQLSQCLVSKESALADLNATLSTKDVEIANLSAAIAKKDTSITELKAALVAMEAKEKTAEQKAVQIVANVGIKPMRADYSGEAEAMDKAQVIAGMHAIKDPVERANFYFKNKATLFGVQGRGK